MATAVAFLALALLVTGAVTATAYAIPIIAQASGDLDGEMMQDRLQMRDCHQDGNMTRMMGRMHMQSQDHAGPNLGNGHHGGENSAPAQNQSRSSPSAQMRHCIQNGKSGTNGAAP